MYEVRTDEWNVRTDKLQVCTDELRQKSTYIILAEVLLKYLCCFLGDLLPTLGFLIGAHLSPTSYAY